MNGPDFTRALKAAPDAAWFESDDSVATTAAHRRYYYPCGCSALKVAAGLCDVYDEWGQDRAELVRRRLEAHRQSRMFMRLREACDL